LQQINDPDFRVYAVWEPFLAADNESKVPFATTKLADERITHYWDEKGKLKKVYQSLMKMKGPAWDVYYLYDRKAEWRRGDPPLPTFDMHQLRILPKEKLLNGETLAVETRKLLAEK
jgi:hypothetical protein